MHAHKLSFIIKILILFLANIYSISPNNKGPVRKLNFKINHRCKILERTLLPMLSKYPDQYCQAAQSDTRERTRQ